MTQFNAFFSERKNYPKNDERDLYQWYCYREQVRERLREGEESLVVSPKKGLVESFQNLLNSMDNYLSQNSKPELDKSFAKRWFAQGTSLLDDRFLLLDSVLYRKSIHERRTGAPSTDLSDLTKSDRTFRDACRSYIESGLRKALRVIGMDSLPELNELGEIDSFCALKAWEVENEMFEKFQGEFGTSRVSDDYRSKARGLKTSLDDKNNVSLCLRILIGEISVVQLVAMSSDQLASEKIRLERARAAKAAKSSALLTPEFSLKKLTSPKPVKPEEEVTPTKPTKTLLQETVKRNRDDQMPTPEAKKAKIENETAKASPIVSPRGLLKSEKKVEATNHESSLASLKASMKVTPKSSRPPPPPSLVSKFQKPAESTPVAEAAESGKDRGMRVTNASGGERYRIDINNPRVSFSAAFYLEDESQAGVDRYLPETLKEKGRLKIHEFSRFLSDKLAGGRWSAIPLRLTTVSDQDGKYYRKFYKEYEVKQRIAMFSINGGSKLFLVTPKFHGSAKSTGLVSLPNKTSTYAIVLTKDIAVLMD